MSLVALWRHPIKGLGREGLTSVDLQANAPMPMDRAWALLHHAAEQIDTWQPRRNFLVVASGPKLAQVTAQSDGDDIVLYHPDLPDLTVNPATGTDAVVAWVKHIWPDDRPAPTRLVKAPPQGMADNGEAQVAILNRASLRALSERVGQDLVETRFRGNVIVDNIPPWGEFDWVGKGITIGEVAFDVTERIERCRATEATPATGLRDANTLRALEDGWGHRAFGVYATVATSGRVQIGDTVIEP